MAFEGDWALLRAGLPELQDYLLSNDLYRPLGLTAPTSYSLQTPQLTIGNLLLSRARLSAADLDRPRRSEFERMARQLEKTRETWRSNWSRKAGREFSSRLNLWAQYLDELRAELPGHAAYFPTEVRQRVILRLLQPELLDGVQAGEARKLRALDAVLRGLSRPGPFVWEPEAAKCFPMDEYWFLYLR
jgi:hypothetical protein